MNHSDRIKRLRAEIGDGPADAMLVTNLTNVRYLTGFSGTNGQLLVTPSTSVFMSDPRYAARAADLVEESEIVIYPAKLSDVLTERVRSAGIAKLGIEADTMTLSEHSKLAADLEGAELVPTSGVVEELRRRKELDEVELIRRAAAIADDAFGAILDLLQPQRSTERDIALELELYMRRAGADEVSFEPIVGFGPHSAHIHHTPSERVLATGDLVLMDFGARVGGYCSDLTRTVVMGAASEEQRDLYELVRRAQEAGLEAIRTGASCRAVDGAARALISDAGKGNAFGHGLGHGLGLDVHEAPRLHRSSDDTLAAGDVVTVEPGVYDVSYGGVRIEDDVLVTDQGAEVLGNAPKDKLIEL